MLLAPQFGRALLDFFSARLHLLGFAYKRFHNLFRVISRQAR